ncbi:MAG: type II/IV secretion system ATPase subunit [Halobacteriaceae archaeon]
MATDQADSGEREVPGETSDDAAEGGEGPAAVGSYTWADFMDEYGYGGEIDALYRSPDIEPGDGVPAGEDWERVDFDPEEHLDFHPDEVPGRVEVAASVGKGLWDAFLDYADPETTPVVKGEWTWEHFKFEYYYRDDASRPTSDGEVVPFDPTDYLDFAPEDTAGVLSNAENVASELADVVDERTVDVNEEIDEDAFFSMPDGRTTITNRYDLEKAVPIAKKTHFREIERYWTNKPYAFVMLFRSIKENETKYYLVEPHQTPIESDLREFLIEKLRAAIKYASEEVVVEGDEQERRDVIEQETRRLLERYDLYEGPVQGEQNFVDRLLNMLGRGEAAEEGAATGIEGLSARPEPALIEEDADTLSQYQVEKLLYLLKRDFIGYERIDGIKHDINVEDISCDGYNSPVFVYHTDHEQIITNVEHGRESLDDFVVKLAQRSGKGISKRQPQVDATLPDGSRAQLTLGREVSDHGTNYTIRQFKDVPFTPIDLINWKTFSLEEMAFLWLCIENNKSLIFAGGTASGKTTSLNAVSLFIPSNTKIVSIEDTREVELPQRNWIASVTRPSFGEEDAGDVDEFDLLEAALRQRPDYIVMGEVRGEEGRTLFQVMSTGHTTYTTFHADSVGEVLKRFTTDPINVSKTLFTALDLVSIQRQTRVGGNKVRRNSVLTEINHYDAENDEINVQDVFEWQPERDEFQQQPASNTLDEIMFDRGWSREELDAELFKRQVVLAYLIDEGLNDYAQVAATVQAFINDPETILTLIANDSLGESLEDLRGMESVLIDVDPEKEAMVPRPDPTADVQEEVDAVLEEAQGRLLDDYVGNEADIAFAVSGTEPDEDVVVDEPMDAEELPDGEHPELGEEESEPPALGPGEEESEDVEDEFGRGEWGDDGEVDDDWGADAESEDDEFGMFEGVEFETDEDDDEEI